MLRNDFHEAERLAGEHDMGALEAQRTAYAKKQARAACIGLAALLHLFFSQWLILRIAPGFVADHPEACRLGYALIGMIGLGLYFGLSKRYSDRGQLTELAIELKARADRAKKEG